MVGGFGVIGSGEAKDEEDEEDTDGGLIFVVAGSLEHEMGS